MLALGYLGVKFRNYLLLFDETCLHVNVDLIFHIALGLADKRLDVELHHLDDRVVAVLDHVLVLVQEQVQQEGNSFNGFEVLGFRLQVVKLAQEGLYQGRFAVVPFELDQGDFIVVVGDRWRLCAVEAPDINFNHRGDGVVLDLVDLLDVDGEFEGGGVGAEGFVEFVQGGLEGEVVVVDVEPALDVDLVEDGDDVDFDGELEQVLALDVAVVVCGVGGLLDGQFLALEDAGVGELVEFFEFPDVAVVLEGEVEDSLVGIDHDLGELELGGFAGEKCEHAGAGVSGRLC